MKFLQSSLQRCRVLPKTSKKINFKTSKSRNTKPKPFVLSTGNHAKKSENGLSKIKEFKARKIPDMTIPFYIFRNDKELTIFEEFEFATSRHDVAQRGTSVEKASTNLSYW